MTYLDEALRALEKKWRDESNRRQESAGEMENDEPQDAAWNSGIAAGLDECADELAALLTTRQEVAPVAYRKLVKTPFGTYWDLSNVMDADHAISTGAIGYEPLYTSTGQTSDARDALDRVDSVLREFEGMTGAGYKYMAANIRAAIKGPK